MPLLGPPQHRLGPRGIAGIVKTRAQQLQADRAQLLEVRRFCQCLKGRLVGLIQGGAQIFAPGVWVDSAGDFTELGRAARVPSFAPADRCPVVERPCQAGDYGNMSSLDF